MQQLKVTHVILDKSWDWFEWCNHRIVSTNIDKKVWWPQLISKVLVHVGGSMVFLSKIRWWKRRSWHPTPVSSSWHRCCPVSNKGWLERRVRLKGLENIPFFIGFDRASSWNIPLFHRCFKLLAHLLFPKGAFCSSSPIECFRKSLYVVEVIEQVFIHQESGMNRELYLPGN